MCHNRTTIRKINRLHERCLRIIYNDKKSSFKMLLEKDSSVSIHDRNIQCLATEMHKVSNGLSPPIISNIFTQKIATLTIFDLLLSFLDLLLGLYFTGPKAYPILVQLSGIFFLIVTKAYQILVFLKTELKNGNLKIVSADFAKHTFLDLALHRLFAPVSWMKLWNFSHSCLYKRELVFKFLNFIIIISL